MNMCSTFIEETLKTWGFEEDIDIFVEHEIDEEAFGELTTDTIKELFPKIGKRVKFIKKYDEYKGLRTNTPTSRTISACDSSDVSLSIRELTYQKSFYGNEEYNALCNPVETLNLQNLLNESTVGKCILKTYEKNSCLNRKHRSDLVDYIIKYIFQSYNSTLSNAQLENIAIKIIELFPNEIKETYYVPPIKKAATKDGKPCVAHGKLVDKYRNCRTKLREAGILSKNQREHINKNTTIDEAIKKSRLWLESRTEPWEELLANWRNTFPIRQTSEAKTVNEYIEEWSPLKLAKGYTLIDIDFDELHPNKGLLLWEEWSSFFNNILLERKSQLTEKNAVAKIELLNEDLSKNKIVALQLELLAYLVPPRGRTRRGKEHWKPSIIECKESIILHSQQPADIEEDINRNCKRKQELGRTIQPYIIVEGPIHGDVYQAYVVVDKIRYAFDSVLRALEVCFKFFHVTNASYPKESEHIWFLIQWALFKIKTAWDKPIPYIMDLITKMNN